MLVYVRGDGSRVETDADRERGEAGSHRQQCKFLGQLLIQAEKENKYLFCHSDMNST